MIPAIDRKAMGFELKAIPTEYNGIQLKSRMEAQCALLFDRLGWKWKYEPFSIMLDNGESYTPDFGITNGDEEDGDIHTIIECRGYENAKGNRQISGFASQLAKIGEEKDIWHYAVIGPKDCRSFDASLRGEINETALAFTYCPSCARAEAGWKISTIKGKFTLCPSCIEATFYEYPLTVEHGKLLLQGAGSELWEPSVFSHRTQSGRWAEAFTRHVLETCGVFSPRDPDFAELNELLRKKFVPVAVGMGIE